MKDIELGSFMVKANHAPYIIAEVGANHNGEIELAKALIVKAKESGAHAVKFQSWTPESLISKEEYDKNQSYDDGDGGKKHFGSLKDMVTKYYLKEDEHYELAKFCKGVGIDFCSSPFSCEEVDLLIKLDVPFIKLASMDINNLSLIDYVAKTRKPIILSTGMASLGEIENAINVIKKSGNKQIILLHCNSIYPPKYEDINLNNIPMLRKAFDLPVGFSDHTIGTSIPLAAVALGACVIEKHFTLDKDMPGWDHKVSSDPEELSIIVKESSNISTALGTHSRVISEDEENKKDKFRRSIVSKNAIKEGDVVTADNLSYKRPGTGISPDKVEYVIGRKVNRNIDADELIRLEDLI